MNPLSFDWNLVRALLATAEHGWYTATTAEPGTTQPTVGRQLATLEAHVQVTLRATGGPLALRTCGLVRSGAGLPIPPNAALRPARDVRYGLGVDWVPRTGVGTRG